MILFFMETVFTRPRAGIPPGDFALVGRASVPAFTTGGQRRPSNRCAVFFNFLCPFLFVPLRLCMKSIFSKHSLGAHMGAPL